MRPGHFRWATDADIPLFLELQGTDGEGVTGQSPTVTIRRHKEVDGAPLDDYYWDGAAFTATPTYLVLTEVDSVDSPGLYEYIFEQSLVGLQYQYLMYFSNPTYPVGYAAETHLVTNEVYIPRTNPDPIVIGPETVMGQLELVKDGGTGLFEGDKDSLHFLRTDVGRILGLLHENSIIDKQQYDSYKQLTYARIRVFDSPGNVPATPGGDELTGLLYEYETEAEYSALNVVTQFVLKRVL